MSQSLRSYISPGHVIVASIFITILVGTALLALPQARVTDIALIDLFFTATSATCVTGLLTISLEQFTTFGQCVILGLIQIGGLGLITTTLVFLYMFTNVGIAAHAMASKILEVESWQYVRRTLLFIALFTLLCELGGSIVLFNIIKDDMSFYKASFIALFHAASSFCNAGIVLGEGALKEYGTDPTLMSVTTLLMFLGGFGFITLYEMSTLITSLFQKKRYRLPLHSSIVIRMSFFLLGASTIAYLLLERTTSLSGVSLPLATLTALFHAVSFKSTGFIIQSIASLQPATIFMLMVIAFIGSSPGSTGSGIKITTFAVFIASIKATLAGRSEVEMYGRCIPQDQVARANTIVAASMLWILTSTFLLLLTEPGWLFGDVLFEALSAFTTLGITSGGTASLSFFGKLIIITSMMIGRIGSLTLLLGLRFTKKPVDTEFSYPEERVMLG